MADLPTITWTSGAPDAGQSDTVMTISNITDRLGEVQASPTSNTLLDRLKTLNSSLAAKGTQGSPSADYISTTTAGEIAHDAADSGNPLKIGAKATTAQSGLTLVANADRTQLYAGIDGIFITRPHTNLEDIVYGNATNTDGSSTECIAAHAAGIKTYLTSIVLCNTSATPITVDIKDGTTVKVSLPLPAGSGCVFNPPVPVPGTAATAWNFDGSAAATTVTCSMIGFKSKV